ncbi:uncharacterized protein LOC117245541 [Parus major]|uniref:uncharacterized protein LOC117245541 n=1 Tax=Parus major TaxID=9157 RepID=UPI001444560F|nr:uncharacterized protein LOC117245541 [Parus major]
MFGMPDPEQNSRLAQGPLTPGTPSAGSGCGGSFPSAPDPRSQQKELFQLLAAKNRAAGVLRCPRAQPEERGLQGEHGTGPGLRFASPSSCFSLRSIFPTSAGGKARRAAVAAPGPALARPGRFGKGKHSTPEQSLDVGPAVFRVFSQVLISKFPLQIPHKRLKTRRYLNARSVSGEVLRDGFNTSSCCCSTKILLLSLRVFIQDSLEEAIFLLCCLCSAGYNTFLIHDEVSKLHSKMNNNDSKRCITSFLFCFFFSLIQQPLYYFSAGFSSYCMWGEKRFLKKETKQRITMKWGKKKPNK